MAIEWSPGFPMRGALFCLETAQSVLERPKRLSDTPKFWSSQDDEPLALETRILEYLY